MSRNSWKDPGVAGVAATKPDACELCKNHQMSGSAVRHKIDIGNNLTHELNRITNAFFQVCDMTFSLDHDSFLASKKDTSGI